MRSNQMTVITDIRPLYEPLRDALHQQERTQLYFYSQQKLNDEQAALKKAALENVYNGNRGNPDKPFNFTFTILSGESALNEQLVNLVADHRHSAELVLVDENPIKFLNDLNWMGLPDMELSVVPLMSSDNYKYNPLKAFPVYNKQGYLFFGSSVALTLVLAALTFLPVIAPTPPLYLLAVLCLYPALIGGAAVYGALERKTICPSLFKPYSKKESETDYSSVANLPLLAAM